ncbi:MAG: helix-turn-helix domain-containing protein [Pseudomonadota bacterium]
MSHRAVNWALEQRDLKPAPWRVLVMLADRHNKDTLRVDPEQALLAYDCAMSRSTVNAHLQGLEDKGLLVRVQRIHPKTSKQMPTFYILEIDFDHPPDVEHAVSDYRTRISEVQTGNKPGARVRNSDTDPVSEKSPIPCPEKAGSRVRNSDTNQGIEPGKEPCAEPAHTPDLPDGFLKSFEQVYPRLGDGEATEAELKAAIEAGADPRAILHGARCYAEEQKGNQRQYIAYSENWVRDGRWKAWEATTPADPAVAEETKRQRIAQAIRDGASWVHVRTSAHYARELIALELVTAEQCKAVGIIV